MTVRLRSALDEIIDRNRAFLHQRIEERRTEMAKNSLEHFRLYEVLGFSEEEGRKSDLYQNIGRFVYKYAGALLEEATVAVFQHTKKGESIRIPNTISPNPKNFEIDFFVRPDNKAHEISCRTENGFLNQ